MPDGRGDSKGIYRAPAKETFGLDSIDSGSAVEQTSGNGYAIIGPTTSAGAGRNDIYFIKTDSDGNAQ